jgi:DNA-binding transcriptional ArsR family regulator
MSGKYAKPAHTKEYVAVDEPIDAAADLKEWRTDEIACRVSLTERQVREHLHTLWNRGYLDARLEGRGFTWRNTGLHRVSDDGEVDLDPADFEDLSEREVAEMERNSIYTWEFRNPQTEHCRDSPDPHLHTDDPVVKKDQKLTEDGPPPG